MLKGVAGDEGESAISDGEQTFTDYALIFLYRLRVYLNMSCRVTIDLLKEILQIIGGWIDLSLADLLISSTLSKAFDWISTSICRVLLRQLAQLHDQSEHAAIEASSTIGHQRAATTVNGSAAGFRGSKSRNLSIQRPNNP